MNASEVGVIFVGTATKENSLYRIETQDVTQLSSMIWALAGVRLRRKLRESSSRGPWMRF